MNTGSGLQCHAFLRINNIMLSPLIKVFLHTEYCYCQYYSIDITLDILGYTLDILGLDILGLDILGLDILGLDILGYTRYSHTSQRLPFNISYY